MKVESEFVNIFSTLSKELDEKNDRYERIVKISRDMTIESKRLIFALLARIRSDDYNKPSPKIEDDIKRIVNFFKNISVELKNEDPYQYIGAFTADLEEFIEALTLYKFMVNSDLLSLDDVRTLLNTEVDSPPSFVPLMQYMLGVQDLTGELMRLCINSLSAKKMEVALSATNFVKELYRAMLKISCYNRDFPKKLYVLKQSLLKMEHAIYTVGIRGSETSSGMIQCIYDPNNHRNEHFD